MLGAITATIATLVVSALLPLGGGSLHDREVTDGKILVGVAKPPSQALWRSLKPRSAPCRADASSDCKSG